MTQERTTKRSRMFVETLAGGIASATDERDPSDPWKALGSQLEWLFGDITLDSDLLNRLYEPSRVREWDDEFVPANLFKLPPTEVEALLEHGKDVDLDLGRYLAAQTAIYLIAPIGRGKSTYVHYQLRIALPKRMPKIRLVPIIFDVRQCTEATEFPTLINKHIGEELDRAFPFFSLDTDQKADTTVHKALCEAFAVDLRRAGLPAKYASREAAPELHERQQLEIARLRREIPIDFNATRVRYARAREPTVLIVLAVDNMDQHLPFPGGEEIIRDSHAISLRLQCPLILTLRDTSFRKNNPGFLSQSYFPKYLALSPGRSQRMLSRRLLEAPKIVAEDKALARFTHAIASQLGVEPGHVNRISELIEEWVEPISNRDRRQMLDVMKSVLSSPHLTSRTFERNRPSKNDYINTDFEIAVAKVKMAILLGRHPYYSDDSYRAASLNLFREDRAHVVDQDLIRLKILQHLYERRGHGVAVREVVEECVSVLGEGRRIAVTGAIVKLIEKGLAVAHKESDRLSAALQRLPIDIDEIMNSLMHITLNGVFHIEVLIKDDIYLDEMKCATPLPTDVYHEVFRHYLNGQWPQQRRQRQGSTLRFLRYLSECETTGGSALSAKLAVPAVLGDCLAAYIKVIDEMDAHLARTRQSARR